MGHVYRAEHSLVATCMTLPLVVRDLGKEAGRTLRNCGDERFAEPVRGSSKLT